MSLNVPMRKMIFGYLNMEYFTYLKSFLIKRLDILNKFETVFFLFYDLLKVGGIKKWGFEWFYVLNDNSNTGV